MKTHRARPRSSSGPTTKRVAKARFGTIGNPAFRALYQPDADSYVPPAEELVIPPAERKTLQMLTESSCRWPIGDPQSPDFHFCNRNKVPGLPYCEHHARRAFQPPQPRRRDREIGEPIVPAIPTQPAKDPVGA
jgi:GcrA cell cycle regulator